MPEDKKRDVMTIEREKPILNLDFQKLQNRVSGGKKKKAVQHTPEKNVVGETTAQAKGAQQAENGRVVHLAFWRKRDGE